MTIDAYSTATEITSALRRKEVSSREMLDLYLARVAAHNPAVNAVVALDADRARAAAAAADEAAARGEWLGPLHGLPITIKDCFETEGIVTTCGDPLLAEYVPDRDALAVARLKAAGAIVFGKTNTPLQTLDGQTYNAVYGTTNNPWDLSRTPGGSSGGAAAALAAGMTPLDLGSDIGGSIRLPAHHSGVFGHKPSWGIVPERGHIPNQAGSLHKRDINVNGPLARGVDDLELALDVIAGPDELDAIGWKLKLPPARHATLRDFRVAAWLEDPFCPSDEAMLAVHNTAAAAIERAGATIDRTARPGFSLKEAVDVFNPLIQAAISPGTRAEISHREVIAADELRQTMRRQWATFFRQFDVLLAPVMLTTAFPHMQEGDFRTRKFRVNGADRPYLEMTTWTGLVGGALLPSTVIPVGLTQSGLPVGIQVIGNFLEDRTTLAFARLASELLGGFRRPPGY